MRRVTRCYASCDVSENEGHVPEAGLLKLNCDKALFDLEWHSVLNFEETIKMTVEWYKEYYQSQNNSMYDFSIGQIEEYVRVAKLNNAAWVCI